MKKIILVGSEHTKRTDYFMKASRELKIPVSFQSIDSCIPEEFQDTVVKLDPFIYKEAVIENMEKLLEQYLAILNRFSTNKNIQFLNHPLGIEEVLNKIACKEKLIRQGIATTKVVGTNISSLEELKESMSKQKAYSVFIKPVRSSGAVGIMAYRFLPKQNQEVLYTSSYFDGNELVNTKTLYRIEEKNKIRHFLNRICSMETIVERWYSKAEYQGKKYDLRVVYQFGKIDFIVARQSNGPITNLHLNNQALSIKELLLPEHKQQEIKILCQKAMELFPTLFSAGIDVMLEKNSMKPLIIEINGQGDLLYQDIYNENLIYKNQILHMYQIAKE